MYLPEPSIFLTASIACVLGGGAIFWFLKTPKLALDALVIAAVCGLCYVVSAGYEARGEAKIQPKLDAAVAKLTELQQEADTFKAAAAHAAEKADAALAQAQRAQATLHTTLIARIHDQTAAVLSVLVAPDVVGVLNDAAKPTAAESNPAADAHAGGAGAGTAGAATPDAGGITVQDLELWGVAVASQYHDCAAQVAGLQQYVNDLGTASNAVGPVQGSVH